MIYFFYSYLLPIIGIEISLLDLSIVDPVTRLLRLNSMKAFLAHAHNFQAFACNVKAQTVHSLQFFEFCHYYIFSSYWIKILIHMLIFQVSCKCQICNFRKMQIQLAHYTCLYSESKIGHCGTIVRIWQCMLSSITMPTGP